MTLDVRPDPPIAEERATPVAARSSRWRAIVGTALLILAVGIGIVFGDALTVGIVTILVALLYLCRKSVFSWRGALIAIALVVCIVPARRYTLPIDLPFAAEPYRLVIVIVAALVVSALLIDRSFRWQRLVLAGPVIFYLTTQLVSIAVNISGLTRAQLAPNAVVSLLSIMLICVLFVITRQIIRTEKLAEFAITSLALFATLIGALATIERVTRVNYIIPIFAALPLQRLTEEESVFVKAGTARAFGAAQHPIALAVFLVMMIPIAIYLAKNAGWPKRPAARELFWMGCALVMASGMIAAVSRTAFVSIAVMAVVALVLRPRLIPRFLFYAVIGIGFALLLSARNVIAMVTELTDPEALIESQSQSPGWTGSGRIADLGPSLEQAAKLPFFGTGLGSRVTIGPSANAFILDNQYLSTLLESGAVGVLGMLVLLLVPFARLAAHSRSLAAPAPDRDLALALAVSILGYAVSLFFFDGFSFIQTVLTFFCLLALGSWVLGRASDERASGLAAPPMTRALA